MFHFYNRNPQNIFNISIYLTRVIGLWLNIKLNKQNTIKKVNRKKN